MCRVISVSKSGFYQWMKRQRQPVTGWERYLLIRIKEVFEQSKKTYGHRRIYKKLRLCNVPCYKNQISKLMRDHGIRPKRKRKYKVTTDSRHNLRISPNLLNRNFNINELNIVWVGDITYIWTKEGWLYLSTVIDLCSRRVVGYSTGKRINKELVIRSMKNALTLRKPKPGLIFHSDRGSQYCSNVFQKILKRNRMTSSMSRKGNCWDNSVAESFFGSLKTERVFDSLYPTRETARRDVVDYIEMFYNSRRRHSYLGYRSPNDFEKMMKLKKAA